MLEIKYDDSQKVVTSRLHDENMTWREILDHIIYLLPSMGHDGINVNDISYVLNTYLYSTGDMVQEQDQESHPEWKVNPNLLTVKDEGADHNMNWGRDEDSIPEELNVIGDDEDEAITDEEDY